MSSCSTQGLTAISPNLLSKVARAVLLLQLRSTAFIWAKVKRNFCESQSSDAFSQPDVHDYRLVHTEVEMRSRLASQVRGFPTCFRSFANRSRYVKGPMSASSAHCDGFELFRRQEMLLSSQEGRTAHPHLDECQPVQPQPGNRMMTRTNSHC